MEISRENYQISHMENIHSYRIWWFILYLYFIVCLGPKNQITKITDIPEVSVQNVPDHNARDEERCWTEKRTVNKSLYSQ